MTLILECLLLDCSACSVDFVAAVAVIAGAVVAADVVATVAATATSTATAIAVTNTVHEFAKEKKKIL